MSAAYKCDLCRRFFEHHLGEGEVDLTVVEKIGDDNRTEGGWQWEACKECLDKVRAFVVELEVST